jgi:hypothetical protein
MKRIILSILLALSAVAGSAQKAPLTDQQIQKMKLDPKQNDSCVRRSYRSFSVRLKNYPFNRAASVQLVSFRGRPDSVGDDYKNEGIPKVNDTICYAKLKEVKALNFTQVDALTDILYNYGYIYRPKAGFLGFLYLGSEPLCYNPHNAILFVDPEGQSLGYIELCFECGAHQETEGIQLGEMCDQKMKMIKRFFKNAGNEYGVTKDFPPGKSE